MEVEARMGGEHVWACLFCFAFFCFGSLMLDTALETPGDYKKLNFCDEGFYGISEV